MDARVRKDGSKVHRARFACATCQSRANAEWEKAKVLADAKGEKPPAKPRVQHFGSWQEDGYAQERWLETMRMEQEYLDRQFLRGEMQRPVCAWLRDRQTSEGASAAAVQEYGQPLAHFAALYLTREKGAESTRVADRRLWEERRVATTGEVLGLKERFGTTPICLIDRAAIRTWLRLLEKEPGRKPGTTLSASQIRQRFFLLRGIMKAALDEDAIDADPSRDVTPPSLPTGRALVGGYWLPSEDEMQRLVYSMREPQALACAVMFGGGLRVGEVTALEVRDLQRHGKQQWTVSITKSESQNKGRSRSATKTGQSGHGVRALPEWVGALIEDYLTSRELKPTDRLFPPLRDGAASMSHTAIRKALVSACKERRFEEIGPQDCRAAGEEHVARVTGSKARAAIWARHGVDVSAKHYVREEATTQSMAAAGWESP